jgi:hypothetical protein
MRLRGERGSWAVRTAGREPYPYEVAEKSAAKKLNGDPQDLIRIMPAKGDRLADQFVAHPCGLLTPWRCVTGRATPDQPGYLALRLKSKGGSLEASVPGGARLMLAPRRQRAEQGVW